MKTIRRLGAAFTGILLAAAILPVLPAAAEQQAGETDSVKYSIQNGEAIITGVTNYDDETLTVPAEIEGYPVTQIGSGALESCSQLLEITLPDSIRTFGDKAFFSCSNVAALKLPAQLETIGSQAFAGCTKLAELTMPDGLKQINSGAFQYCIGLTELQIPDSVETISGSAFLYCTHLTSVTLPASLETLGGSAFSNCTRLENVVFPEHITSFGADAFNKTPWLTAQREADPLVVMQHYLIDGQTAAGEVTIPETVDLICDNAFRGNAELTAVQFHDGIRSIGAGAFAACTGLTEITLPPELTALSASVFSGCSGLQQITFPAKLREIGSGALARTAFTELVIPATVTSIGAAAFYGCENLASVTILNPGCSLYIDPPRVIGNTVNTIFTNETYEGVLRGYKGSTAESYAARFGFRFEEIASAVTRRGDTDCNDTVDISDAVLLARYLVEDKDAVLTDQGLLNGDCNGSGEPDSDDVVMIVRHTAQLIDLSA